MPFSSSQLLELFVVLCVVDHFRYGIFRIGTASVHAESMSGRVRPESMPTRLSRTITPVQLLSYFVVPMLYVFSVANNRFQQPVWIHALALPEVAYGIKMEPLWKNTVRVLACVASVALQRISDNVLEHLDDQFHPIGRREKQRVVQTGPYAWVRHPLYALMLLQEVLWSLMFWSYAPLIALVATIAIFAVKIRIEEDAIQQDDANREEYRAYMQKVPSKLVPFIY